MTAEEIRKIAETHQDAVLIGAEDERDRYYPAIVAFDGESGRFVYDYQMLVEAFAYMFRDDDGGEDTVRDAEKSIDRSKDSIEDDHLIFHKYTFEDLKKAYTRETDALEWVDYNVIRSLPYYGDRAPFVLYVDEDSDDVMDACTSKTADERIAKLYKDGMNSYEA